MNEKALRDQLREALAWGQAHIDWKSAVEGVPPEARGKKPAGAPHSLWELLEHTRLAQRDILEFSRFAGFSGRLLAQDKCPSERRGVGEKRHGLFQRPGDPGETPSRSPHGSVFDHSAWFGPNHSA
jgi:hypothetical protein